MDLIFNHMGQDAKAIHSQSTSSLDMWLGPKTIVKRVWQKVIKQIKILLIVSCLRIQKGGGFLQKNDKILMQGLTMY